jgi:hypothetical protein
MSSSSESPTSLSLSPSSQLVVTTTHSGHRFSPFLLLLAPLFTPLLVVLGGAPRPPLGATFPTALNENSPDYLLTRGVPGSDVKALLRGLWLVMAKLMHQGSAVRDRPEHQDDVDIADFGELMTLLGETSHVVPQGFTLFLHTTL